MMRVLAGERLPMLFVHFERGPVLFTIVLELKLKRHIDNPKQLKVTVVCQKPARSAQLKVVLILENN